MSVQFPSALESQKMDRIRDGSLQGGLGPFHQQGVQRESTFESLLRLGLAQSMPRCLGLGLGLALRKPPA